MVSYEETRRLGFAAAAMATVNGVALDVHDAPLPDALTGLRPVLWCTCVTETCRCDGPVMWIDAADVRQEVPTDRQHKTGGQVQEIKLDADATVLVESIVGTKAATLAAGCHGREPVDYRFALRAAYPGRTIHGVSCTEIDHPCRWPFGFLTCRDTICTDPDAGPMFSAYY